MCGIVGLIGHQITTTEEKTNEILDVMEHRGRDNRGIVSIKDDEVIRCTILGHNRLAINDLSPAGNQPFVYEDVSLVCNGEIWNSPQLRDRYEKRGYKPFSTSDNEVIIYAYLEDELKILDGMFSFILEHNGRVIVSRDWMGKMPLYYAYNHQLGQVHYLFSSEIKGLLRGDIPREGVRGKNNTIRLLRNNMVMVLDWREKQYNISYVKHSESVRDKIISSNAFLTADQIETQVDEYEHYYHKWSKTYIDSTEKEVADKTYELLDNSVRKRLLSDVPVATCLSGGLDSSIITYLLKQYVPDIKAYTVSYDQNSLDLKAARLVAESIGVELIEVVVPNDLENLVDRFKKVLDAYEYTMTVQQQVGMMQSYVAERMAQDGIKVAFSGEGSDEAYGSYGRCRKYLNKPDWNSVRQDEFIKQNYGNLLRGNTIFMYFGTIELRCPFFDRDFLNYTTNLRAEHTSFKNQWKLPLANAFRGKLPDEIIDQEKRAFQTGTNFKDDVENKLMNRNSGLQIDTKPATIFSRLILFQFQKRFGFNPKMLLDKYSVTGNTIKEIKPPKYTKNIGIRQESDDKHFKWTERKDSSGNVQPQGA